MSSNRHELALNRRGVEQMASRIEQSEEWRALGKRDQSQSDTGTCGRNGSVHRMQGAIHVRRVQLERAMRVDCVRAHELRRLHPLQQALFAF